MKLPDWMMTFFDFWKERPMTMLGYGLGCFLIGAVLF